MVDNKLDQMAISIHTLRVEGDVKGFMRRNSGSDFYPHPPCGG